MAVWIVDDVPRARRGFRPVERMLYVRGSKEYALHDTALYGVGTVQFKVIQVLGDMVGQRSLRGLLAVLRGVG